MTISGRSLKVVTAVAAFSFVASAHTFCLTVAGLGGEQEYEQRFQNWAKDVDKTMKSANTDITVETLYGPAATRERIRATLQKFSTEAKPTDELIVMMIGHGSFDGTEYKINIPGPDLSGTELASLLDRIAATHQLVINMTSASGGSLHALEKPNRTVITATKSGTEKNATVFARYWVEALRDPAADTDKNETITALEAFKYAETKTKQYYDTAKHLATEHPMIDGGESTGTAGAQRFALLRIGGKQALANDPAKRGLLVRREQIEKSIDDLKAEKGAMDPADYKKQLTSLLLDLSRVQAELDK